jgi:hypothetical protein
MTKFAYNNTMHSSIHWTPLFAGHGLHPKFNIQGVHKVMNPTVEDWAMWLTNVWTQLVFNLEEAQRWYKENVNEHGKEFDFVLRSGTKFGFDDNISK